MTTTQRKPRALILAHENWATGGRFAAELRKAQFMVAIFAPKDHAAHRAQTADASFSYGWLRRLEWLQRSIEEWRPDLVLAADDVMLCLLKRLYAVHHAAPRRDSRYLCDLIELSLGEPSHFAAMEKSQITTLARQLNLRCPATMEISDYGALKQTLASREYPVVIKVDRSTAGRGVRIVRNATQARQAFSAFLAPAVDRPKLQKLVRTLPAPAWKLLRPRRPTIQVQDYIAGQPAHRCVACWRGDVLGGNSFAAMATWHETGPATMVRPIENAEMTATAEALVRHLGISGFCGVDFVLDDDGRAWLLEINQRFTQTTHLVCGADLIGLLTERLMGPQSHRHAERITNAIIALFPGAWQCDSEGEYMQSAYCDVPRDEPALMRQFSNLFREQR